MDKIEAQIRELVYRKGKSANEMSSGLKLIGNGSMEDGIRRLATFYHDSGYSKAEQAGIMKGIGGTIGGITMAFVIYQIIQHIKQKIQMQKELEKEGKEIIAALEGISENAEEERSETPPEDANPI